MLPLEGVFAAVVTPRRLGSQDINLAATWELFDFVHERGVQGIVLHGSTGEFVHYPSSERMRVMGLAAKRSRIPVVINVSHSTLDGALELAQAATASGAAGILVMPPYFFRYSRDEVRRFCLEFRDQARANVPLLLYNIPQFTNEIPDSLAEELLAQGGFAGIKDSSGRRESYELLRGLRQQRQFTLLMGSDELWSAVRGEGVSGVVSGVACAIPELIAGLNRAMRGGAPEVTARLEARLAQFLGWLAKFPTPVGIKEAVTSRGIKAGPHALPVDEAQLAEFREWFKRWLPDVQKETKHA